MEQTKKRPSLISLVCILGFIAYALIIFFLLLDKTPYGGNIVKWPSEIWLQVLSGSVSIINFFCLVFIWKMKKWAAFTYAGMFIISQTVNLITGSWSIGGFLFSGVIIGIILAYIKRMD